MSCQGYQNIDSPFGVVTTEDDAPSLFDLLPPVSDLNARKRSANQEVEGEESVKKARAGESHLYVSQLA